MRAWHWMKFCMSTVDGSWTKWSTLSPIRIIVRMPEPENLKVEDLSKSVKQAPHSEQATGHGVHCREILFRPTPRCSPRAREFTRSGRLFCTTYSCGATGRQTCPFSDFGLCRRYMRSNECPSSFLMKSLLIVHQYLLNLIFINSIWSLLKGKPIDRQ